MRYGIPNEMVDGQLVGESEGMQKLKDRIAALAGCDVNLLLQGESGTGKELVSRAVHRASARRDEAFVAINCAAVHETLLESELFGHEVGAFTGAVHARLGFLRAADGGTILLDEVGDMSAPLQGKLLRVLEERAVIPVGGTKPIGIDVRVIAATHHDLGRAVELGRFRQDLYYRLNVVQLTIPPLRRRPGDIPLLARHMLKTMASVVKMPVKTISTEAMGLLMRHDWPGNVRELGNVIQHAYALGHGTVIRPEDLPEAVLVGQAGTAPAFRTIRQVVRDQVSSALTASGGVRSQAAKMLGIDRTSLWRMMRRYDMT